MRLVELIDREGRVATALVPPAQPPWDVIERDGRLYVRLYGELIDRYREAAVFRLPLNPER